MSYQGDIMLNDDNTLKITDGDFVIADGGGQNIKNIIEAAKGSYAWSPLVGVGAIDAINGPQVKLLRREVAAQAELDGFTYDRIDYKHTDGETTLDVINAKY